MDEKQFRTRLDEATHGFPRKHIERIADLKNLYPHNIKLHGNPNVFDSDDCFLYIFRELLPIALLRSFLNLISEQTDIFERICRDLIREEFVSLHAEQIDSDRIVVYFLDNDPKHYGRIECDKVISKWGKGYAWEHGLFEVPLSYGEKVKFSDGVINLQVFEMMIEKYKNQSMEV